MTRYVVLLRGINLGTRNRIAMPALRDALVEHGFDDVRTHLQSGNVLLSIKASTKGVVSECEQVIADRFGLEIAVVVRTRDQLAEVVRRNPLAEVVKDSKRYHVVFLGSRPDAAAVEKLKALAVPPEQLAHTERELYAWYPGGSGRSKLATALTGPRLGVTSTARNWSTVTKLLALADEDTG